MTDGQAMMNLQQQQQQPALIDRCRRHTTVARIWREFWGSGADLKAWLGVRFGNLIPLPIGEPRKLNFSLEVARFDELNQSYSTFYCIAGESSLLLIEIVKHDKIWGQFVLSSVLQIQGDSCPIPVIYAHGHRGVFWILSTVPLTACLLCIRSLLSAALVALCVCVCVCGR